MKMQQTRLIRGACWLFVLVLGLISMPGHASDLTNIGFTPVGQDSFEMSLSLSSAETVDAQVFVIENPARIVVDLPSVVNRLPQRDYALSFSNATRAVVLGTPDRTRIVLELNLSASYQINQSGSVISLRVGSAGSAPEVGNQVTSVPAPVPTPRNNPAAATPRVLSIDDLDFRRGVSGEGNLTLELNGAAVSADVEQAGSTVTLRFYDANLPIELQQNYDVVDFATPVSGIRAQQQGSQVVFVLNMDTDYDYLAYQADDTYVLSVKPLTYAQQIERAREFAYTGEKLSLNFQDIEVRAVLQLIADFTGLNLVASDTVSGNITLRLENVPWDQALDIVLKTKGLDSRKEGTILMVAPLDEIAERERLEVEANKQLEQLAALRTEFIRIRYADAQDIYDLVTNRNQLNNNNQAAAVSQSTDLSERSLISERGHALVDGRTNTIILTDTEDRIASFRAFVDQVDIPIRQVMIEARIVIANTDFQQELGVRWGGAGVRTVDGGDGAFQFSGSRDGFADGGPIGFFNGDNDLALDDVLGVDLGVDSATSSFGIAFLTDSAWIDLELSALENEGHGEVVSQPKVVTGDKQTALIRSGQEVAYQSSAASGATTTEFREAVLSLEVTPQITPDNRVILDLNITQDSIGDLVFDGEPTIEVTELNTQVLVDNGQTLVLGGIFQMTNIESEDRVPVLGSLPIVGHAFRNSVTDQEKREVLIFITPKVLTDQIISP